MGSIEANDQEDYTNSKSKSKTASRASKAKSKYEDEDSLSGCPVTEDRIIKSILNSDKDHSSNTIVSDFESKDQRE